MLPRCSATLNTSNGIPTVMGKKLKIAGSVLVMLIGNWLAGYFVPPRTGLIVETTSGKIQGIISKSRDGRDFYEWLGIPYAKPPVGLLRYSSPYPAKKWDGIKFTGKYGPDCPQIMFPSRAFTGQEDCLYLNVHVPKLSKKSGEVRHKIPVMVWIHGGGFTLGSAQHHRPDYFMDEEVILVTFNYRLGNFGFLSTGDKVVRGNMGLKDQRLALQWVTDNIQSFGGDPFRIVVFGQDAGGASVHYHLLSYKSRGLFSAAISQSGIAGLPHTMNHPKISNDTTRRFATALGCYNKDSLTMVKCLRGKTMEELLSATLLDVVNTRFLKPQLNGSLFLPTIEAVNDSLAFMIEHPLKIVKDEKQFPVPWMVGVTAHEGLLMSTEFIKNASALKSFEKNWNQNVIKFLTVRKHPKNLTETLRKMRNFYFKRSSKLSAKEKIHRYTRLFSDLGTNLYVSHVAEKQRFLSPVHLYYYNRRNGPCASNFLAELKGDLPLGLETAWYHVKSFVNYYILGRKQECYGVSHGDDLFMLFPIFGTRISKNANDPYLQKMYKFSKDLVKLWVRFATDEEEFGFRGQEWWPLRAVGSLECMEISEKPKTMTAPFESRIKFLKSLKLLPKAAQKKEPKPEGLLNAADIGLLPKFDTKSKQSK